MPLRNLNRKTQKRARSTSREPSIHNDEIKNTNTEEPSTINENITTNSSVISTEKPVEKHILGSYEKQSKRTEKIMARQLRR